MSAHEQHAGEVLARGLTVPELFDALNRGIDRVKHPSRYGMTRRDAIWCLRVAEHAVAERLIRKEEDDEVQDS